MTDTPAFHTTGKRPPRRMTRKSRRLWLVLACLGSFSIATGLVLNAFSSSIVFFMAPSQVLASPPAADRVIRLGGMVVAGSVRRSIEGQTPVNRFEITDGQAAIDVRYEAFCLICSVKDKAWWRWGPIAREQPSSLRKCSPNTMRPTCPKRSPRLCNEAANGTHASANHPLLKALAA